MVCISCNVPFMSRTAPDVGKRYREKMLDVASLCILCISQGKKFRTAGRSSVARHYRIQGRGGGVQRTQKATGLPSNPIILPMRR